MSAALPHIATLGALAWDRPLLVLAAALAAAPAVMSLLARRRGSAVPLTSVLAQTLAISLLALAAAGPGIEAGGRSQLPYAVFHDASASVRGQSPTALPLPPQLARVDYLFAAEVVRAAVPPAQSTAARPAALPATLPADQAAATNLADVLRIASAQAAALAGVIIATDGNWQDDWRQAAAAMGQTRLPLLIVPLDSPPPDARISALAARRLPDGTVRLKVSVESNSPMRRRLTVSRGGLPAPLLDNELTLLPQAPAEITLTDSPGTQLAGYEAAISPADAFPENDHAQQTVLPQLRTAALIAAGDADAIALPLRAHLGVDVLDAAKAPASTDGYLPYCAVIVVDSTGQLLPEPARAALARYVRDGGGLVLLGAGPYSSPAERDDPLNAVAALVANPYQRAPLRLSVVLDSSGSMAEPSASPGQTKFQLACQAVLSLQKHLTPSDSLAVISYSDSARVIYDSKSAPPDFAAIGDALRAISPQGPTQVLPALRLAVSTPPPKDRQGLVLLVSDLLTEPYDTSRPALVEQVAAIEKSFRAGPWKLAVVATRAPLDAPEMHTALEELSRRLDSRLVRREGLAGIADVFRQFVREARGEPLARGSFDVKFAPDALGLADLRLPAVEQYLLCAATQSAAALGAVGGDPLLAIRQVGLGRSASLALPLPPAGNAALRGDAQLDRLIAAMLNWTQRVGDDGRFQLRATARAGGLDVRLDAIDSSGPINSLELSAQMRAGDGSRIVALPLLQVAPGTYSCRLPPPAPGAWLAVSDGRRTLRSAALERTYGNEFAAIGADWDNLRKLAELAGGRVARRSELEGLTLAMHKAALTPLRPYLLAAALLLMLLDWCAGRIVRRG